MKMKLAYTLNHMDGELESGNSRRNVG